MPVIGATDMLVYSRPSYIIIGKIINLCDELSVDKCQRHLGVWLFCGWSGVAVFCGMCSAELSSSDSVHVGPQKGCQRCLHRWDTQTSHELIIEGTTNYLWCDCDVTGEVTLKGRQFWEKVKNSDLLNHEWFHLREQQDTFRGPSSAFSTLWNEWSITWNNNGQVMRLRCVGFVHEDLQTSGLLSIVHTCFE